MERQNIEVKGTLQSHFVTTQQFSLKKLLSSFSSFPFTSLSELFLLWIFSLEMRRRKKAINYKNQLPFQLNQIANCKKNLQLRTKTFVQPNRCCVGHQYLRRNWRIYMLCDCSGIHGIERAWSHIKAGKFITQRELLLSDNKNLKSEESIIQPILFPFAISLVFYFKTFRID